MIHQNLLLKFNDFLAETMGLFFPKNSWGEFEKKISLFAKEFGFEDSSECLEWLMKAPLSKEQISVLARHLTIGETYFFRDVRTFSLLKNEILPQIIRNHQKDKCIRIWSAACCTGEEPYSIAILLSQLLPDIIKWDIIIFGTDINPSFLQKAQSAQYKQWSFRLTSKEIQAKYFNIEKNGCHTLIAEIKKMVRFSYFNLVEETNFNQLFDDNSVDLIICNNVLIYFSQEQIKKTIHLLSQKLNKDGRLMVASVEAPYVNEKKLIAVNIDGFTLFRKKRPEELTQEEEAAIPFKSPFLKSPIFQENKSSILKIELPSFLNLKNSSLEIRFDNDEKLFQTHIQDKTPPRTASIVIVPPARSEHSQNPEAVVSDPDEQKKQIVTHILNLANTGKLDEAKKHCEKLLEIDKLDPVLHYLYATILQSKNENEAAIKALKRVVYLDSSFSIAYFMLGTLLKKQGNLKEARRHFRNAIQLLEKCLPDEKIPGTDEMTAATLLDVIKKMKL